MSALKDAGLYDNTIIVLLADHGEEFWEREKWDHGDTVHQELLHIPMIIKIPGAAPARIASRIRSIDLYPTLLDLSGLPYDPKNIQGESLASLIKDGNGPDRTLMSESCLYYEEQKSAAKGDLKIIMHAFRHAPELYDLKNDPLEQHDISAERPDDLKEMKALLDSMNAANADMRKRLLGKTTQSNKPLSPAMIEQMKALGYVQ